MEKIFSKNCIFFVGSEKSSNFVALNFTIS